MLSRAANLAPDDQNGQHPGMLTRFVTVIFHALIHVGYGAEFGLLGLSAEGDSFRAVDFSVPADHSPARFGNDRHAPSKPVAR